VQRGIQRPDRRDRRRRRILLKATKAKLVVVSARMQSVHGKPTRKALEEIDPAVSLPFLDETSPAGPRRSGREKLLSSSAASWHRSI